MRTGLRLRGTATVPVVPSISLIQVICIGTPSPLPDRPREFDVQQPLSGRNTLGLELGRQGKEFGPRHGHADLADALVGARRRRLERLVVAQPHDAEWPIFFRRFACVLVPPAVERRGGRHGPPPPARPPVLLPTT